MGDGGGWRGTAENIGKYWKTGEESGRGQRTTDHDGGRWGTVGDDTMSSVLVLGSYLSDKFRKRWDWMTKCRSSLSLPRPDGPSRCKHCSGIVGDYSGWQGTVRNSLGWLRMLEESRGPPGKV